MVGVLGGNIRLLEKRAVEFKVPVLTRQGGVCFQEGSELQPGSV